MNQSVTSIDLEIEEQAAILFAAFIISIITIFICAFNLWSKPVGPKCGCFCCLLCRNCYRSCSRINASLEKRLRDDDEDDL